MAEQYVKFLRGTTAAYDKVAIKAEDTLYFIADDNSDHGRVYLGSTLMATGSLDELVNVSVSAAENKNLLGYDTTTQTWVPMTIEQALGGSVIKETQVFEIPVAAGANHAEEIAGQTATATLQAGDIAIVKETIADDKQQYTAYVYNGSVWAAMDGNYDASNVYFSNDITYTTNVGTLQLTNGATSATLAAKGKSLESILKGILAKTVGATATPASYSLSASATTTTTEIGGYITALKWDGTFTDGSYNYKSKEYPSSTAAGLTATYEMSTATTGAITTDANVIDGSFTLEGDNRIQLTKTGSQTYASITGVCTVDYSNVRTPVNNIGEPEPEKILSSPTSITKTANVTVNAYRNTWYYVGTDCTSALDSAFIRSATAKNANTTSFGTVAIPAGTKRVMFAVLGSATMSSCIDVDGMGLDVKDNFTSQTVAVEGANGFEAADYTVFVCDNPNGLAKTSYTVTIKR